MRPRHRRKRGAIDTYHTPFLDPSHVVDSPSRLVLSVCTRIARRSRNCSLVCGLLEHLLIVRVVRLQILLGAPGVRGPCPRRTSLFRVCRSHYHCRWAARRDARWRGWREWREWIERMVCGWRFDRPTTSNGCLSQSVAGLGRKQNDHIWRFYLSRSLAGHACVLVHIDQYSILSLPSLNSPPQPLLETRTHDPGSHGPRLACFLHDLSDF